MKQQYNVMLGLAFGRSFDDASKVDWLEMNKHVVDLKEEIISTREIIESFENYYIWGYDERKCVGISPDEYQKYDLKMMDFIEEELRNKNRISFFSRKFLDDFIVCDVRSY